MDTTIYFFAGYVAFWLLPTLYIFQIVKRLDHLEGGVGRKRRSK